MDRALAEQRLKNMTAWQTDPALEQADIDMLLTLSRRTDVNGVGWDASGWVPTFDLPWAAAEAWCWKAASVSNRYLISGDGSSLERHQIFQHCEKLYELYRKRTHASVHVIRAPGNLVVDRGTTSTVPWWWEVTA